MGTDLNVTVMESVHHVCLYDKKLRNIQSDFENVPQQNVTSHLHPTSQNVYPLNVLLSNDLNSL